MTDNTTTFTVDMRGDSARVTATGGALEAIYRGHLDAFGPDDEATKEVFWAVVNRQTWTVDLDGHDAFEVAGMLDGLGLRDGARKLRWVEAYGRAEELREQAADLEWEAGRMLARSQR